MLILGANTGIVYAKDYYVPEDGVSDASDALQTALNTNANVALSPGVTYIVTKPVVLQAGQTIWGNGATLKRKAQVSTTTVTAITSGVTSSITVASATGFVAGMYITVEKAGTYDTVARLITSVIGNVITISGTFGVTLTATINVYQTGDLLQAFQAQQRIYDLRIDGNKANWTFARWEITSDIHFGGDRTLIQGVDIVNSPGEGMQADAGSSNIAIRDCWMRSTNGNGLHLSGNAEILIDGCKFLTCNIDTNVGHADGCISFSNTISHCKITNCHFDGGLAGIGSIDSPDNSDVTITNNEFRNGSAYAIEMRCLVTDAGFNNVIIANNRFYDTVKIDIDEALATPADFPDRIQIVNNIFENTRVEITRARYVEVCGNQFENSADTTNKIVDVQDCLYATIGRNKIVGGAQAIFTDASNMTSLLVDGNQCLFQVDRAITSNVASIPARICNNMIENNSGAAAGYDGIIGRARCVVHGNHITLNKGHAGIYPQDGCIVSDNYVRHGAATFSIRCDGGSANIIVDYNKVTAAVSDGAANTLTGNVTVP